MSYKNATQLLPEPLLEEIQQYVDGEFLYIPRKIDNKQRWGAATDTKAELALRNRRMYQEYQSGLTARQLADRYYLSPKTVQNILRRMKSREGAPAMYIETQRLIITRFTPDMAQSVHENSLDEDNRRFVPDEVFETVEDAAETIDFLIGCYQSGDGPLVYPILLKTGQNIGYVQAVPLEDGEWEIGYHIAAAHTRKGYAAEAVTAFLPVILHQLDIARIRGVCLAENKASVKVLERCGFVKTFEGISLYQGEPRPVCRYVYGKN